MAFGGEVHCAMLINTYGNTADTAAETRYSPAQCTGVRRIHAIGHPDLEDASTSYVERQSLAVRMLPRRFTRMTNGCSKKVENHAHAVAFFLMYYNLCRIHGSLRVTPAMEASVVNTMWDVGDMIEAFPRSLALVGRMGLEK